MKDASSMYFLSLEVENIRCFGEKQTLDLSDGAGKPARWTLLLGDNGVGKTTLLQCLTWMRTDEESELAISTYPDQIRNTIAIKMKAFTGKKSIVKPIMDALEENTEMEALIRAGDDMKSSIMAKYSLNSSFNDQKGSARKKVHTAQVGMILERRHGKLEEVHPIPDCLASFNTPNLFAYSASRHMVTRNLDISELRDPVANFTSDSADLYDAEQVLISLDHQALKNPKGNAGPLLIKVMQLLSDLLPELEKADDIKILGPKEYIDGQESGGVLVHMPYGPVSLAALSLGYKTMLAWAVDLAIRLLWSNRESPAPLEEPAIVIIDEIDLHLHPKWQRQVKTFLCKHFPNVQFICTAHSPFMAQAAEYANVAVLIQDGDHVIIENDPLFVKGWRIDQIATSNLIGVPSARSIDVEAFINERRAILDKKKKSSKDKVRLAELDEIISALPTEEDPDDQAALELIRKAAELIRQDEK